MIDLIKLKNIIKSIDVDLTEEDLFNFLKIKRRWPFKYTWGQSSVQILSNNGYLQSNYIFDLDGFVNFEKWKKFYDLGFTSVISNILDLNDDLRNIYKQLSEATGLNINGNFYFSKPGQLASFEPHKHNYDVIIKQIYGQSNWVIEDNKFVMKPKDTCIIKKNSIHQVIDKKEKKLSLTINIE